jgi:hypothetical protein
VCNLAATEKNELPDSLASKCREVSTAIPENKTKPLDYKMPIVWFLINKPKLRLSAKSTAHTLGRHKPP